MWTETAYLALGETNDRVELIDGVLHVGPLLTVGHQAMSSQLCAELMPAAEAAGLRAYRAVNVRLRQGRIVIPDVVVSESVDPATVVSDAAAVRLICEVVSPGNDSADLVLKMRLYAEASIPWYLIVEQQDGSVLLRLFWLDSDHYVEHASGKAGKQLVMTEPVVVTLNPDELLYWW